MTDPALAALLFVQLAVILAVCRALGSLFARLRQPLVVAEMVGGFLLGPSLLGWVLPEVAGVLFAPASLSVLQLVSQLGLILFMFLVGIELDPALLRGRESTIDLPALSTAVRSTPGSCRANGLPTENARSMAG